MGIDEDRSFFARLDSATNVRTKIGINEYGVAAVAEIGDTTIDELGARERSDPPIKATPAISNELRSTPLLPVFFLDLFFLFYTPSNSSSFENKIYKLFNE